MDLKQIKWKKDLPKDFVGADISAEFCGVKLQSPIILSSGPLSFAAEGLIRAHDAGAGAVVTKTIRLDRAINPYPHIAAMNSDSLINCEKWADSDRLVWYEREIPMTKAVGAVVIASVGHTLEESANIVADCQKAGADFIELVSYSDDTMIPMLDDALKKVTIPIICKLSSNYPAWADPVGTAKRCLEMGAAGIAAIDSIGPTLKIDIFNKKPAMGSEDGFGWMSGGAMRPISMRINSLIARLGFENLNLYGIGGVTCAEDMVEYLMTGCKAVGVCSIGIIKGIEYFTTLNKDLSILLKKLGYNSLQEAIGVALPNFPTKGAYPVVGEYEKNVEADLKIQFKFDPDYAPCQQTCPAGIDVPLYVDQVRRGSYLDAYNTNSVNNPFPAICGRVCDHPCEANCRRGEIDEPIAIRLLKRVAADEVYAACGNALPLPSMLAKNGKKIAIIGAGPAGLSAAYYMSRKGYQVKVFESLPVAGGMLAVGIPDYRLPRDIMNKEIARLENMGVEIRLGVTVGKDISMAELTQMGYERILIATGAHGDPEMGVPGEDLAGVLSGIKFLRDVNLGQIRLDEQKVIVVGGGNVAVDAARAAIRVGAAEVTIVYRRDKGAMPAYAEEIEHAEQEGIKFAFLAAPAAIKKNAFSGLDFEYTPMMLGEMDASGRRSPRSSGAANITMKVDTVIAATGQKIITDFMPKVVSMESGATESANIYVAGDCATGPASVIKAIAMGRKAAEAMDSSLGGDGVVMEAITAVHPHFVHVADDNKPRMEATLIPVEDRVPGFAEVENGLAPGDAAKEAERCLHCGCINCGRCVEACSYDARVMDFPGMTVDRDLCRNCGFCLTVCPTAALTGELVTKFSADADPRLNQIGIFS